MYVALRVIVPSAFPIPLHGMIMYLLFFLSDTSYQLQNFFLLWETQGVRSADFGACPAEDDAVVRVFDDEFLLFLVVFEHSMGAES